MKDLMKALDDLDLEAQKILEALDDLELKAKEALKEGENMLKQLEIELQQIIGDDLI